MLSPVGAPHQLALNTLIGGFVMRQPVMGLQLHALLLHALWQAHRLFAAFARDEIPLGAAGGRLFRIGLAFALVLPAQLVAPGVASWLARWGNPPGGLALALSIDPAHAMLAAAGPERLTAGWALAEAARIADHDTRIV